MNKNSLVYTVIFTFITAFFFVFILSAANIATSPKIAENEKSAVYTAFLSAAGITFEDKKEAEKIFTSYFPGVEYYNLPDVLKADISGETILFRMYTGRGLWGPISGVLAVNEDYSKIAGLEIISHNETPGLGGRIDEDWFKDQFAGEVIPPDGISVRKGSGTPDTDSSNGEVDGITGATLTSTSIETIVNDVLSEFKKGGSIK